MNLYTMRYEVRNRGAIGIFWPKTFTISAENRERAIVRLLRDYTDVYEFRGILWEKEEPDPTYGSIDGDEVLEGIQTTLADSSSPTPPHPQARLCPEAQRRTYRP